METCFNYTETGTAYFSSDERKWIAKVRKLAEKYPDEVLILKQPEDNDGCIYAKMPTAWLKIQPKRVLSEETKAKLSANAKKMFAQNFQNIV